MTDKATLDATRVKTLEEKVETQRETIHVLTKKRLQEEGASNKKVPRVDFVPAEDTGKKKESQADRLVRYSLNQDMRLFVDQFNDPYARFRLMGDLYVTYRLRGRDFKTYLAGLMWVMEEKAPNGESISSAINVLEAMGRKAGQTPLYNRVAPDDQGGIWIDMANDQWQGIHVTKTGWEIVDSVSMPILFRRYAHQKPLPNPVRDGDAGALLDFANLTEEGDRLLYVVTAISYFVPGVPHIVLIFFGPQGSGKSWALSAVRAVVDPSSLDLLALPRRDAELVQQLSHNYCSFYDNTGTIPDWISNALCRASTGTGFSKRQLYTDDDDIILAFRRCCGLTNINVAAERGDLLDRGVLLGFEAISPNERRTDKALEADLERKVPVILGGVLDVLSKAIALYPQVELDGLFRMADYHRWGVAITQAMGLDPKTFVDAYSKNVERQSLEAIKASPVAEVLIAFMATQEDGAWTGTASQLYGYLDGMADLMNISTRQKAWAKTPTVLSRRLNELVPSLPAVGIHVERGYRGRDRLIIINADGSYGSHGTTDATDASAGVFTPKTGYDTSTDARALAIKAILTRAGGEVKESQLNAELLLADMDVEGLDNQLKDLETYGFLDKISKGFRLGKAWKDEKEDGWDSIFETAEEGDQVE